MQDEWIREWEHEQDKCQFHGGPLSECGDDEADWFPQMTICWPTAQLEAAKQMYADLHSDRPFTDGDGGWSSTRSRAHPFHYSDGVSFWLSKTDDNPDADWLSASEVVPQEPEGE